MADRGRDIPGPGIFRVPAPIFKFRGARISGFQAIIKWDGM
jgi:hypothetical protein